MAYIVLYCRCVVQVCYPCAVQVDAEATMDRVQWRLLRIKDHLQVRDSCNGWVRFAQDRARNICTASSYVVFYHIMLFYHILCCAMLCYGVSGTTRSNYMLSCTCLVVLYYSKCCVADYFSIL